MDDEAFGAAAGRPGHEPEPTLTATNRREVLRRIGVGAGVAWAAPTILSQQAAAAASGPVPPLCIPSQLVDNPYADAGTTGWTIGLGAVSTFPYPGTPFIPPAGPGGMLMAFGISALASGDTTFYQTVAFSPLCTSFSVAWYWQGLYSPPALPGLISATVAFNDPGSTTIPASLPTISDLPPPPPGSVLLDPFGPLGGPIPAGATEATITFTVLSPYKAVIDVVTFDVA